MRRASARMRWILRLRPHLRARRRSTAPRTESSRAPMAISPAVTASRAAALATTRLAVTEISLAATVLRLAAMATAPAGIRPRSVPPTANGVGTIRHAPAMARAASALGHIPAVVRIPAIIMKSWERPIPLCRRCWRRASAAMVRAFWKSIPMAMAFSVRRIICHPARIFMSPWRRFAALDCAPATWLWERPVLSARGISMPRCCTSPASTVMCLMRWAFVLPLRN